MSKFTIKEVKARQVYDSRANPTVEVDILLEDGSMGRGTVPSGASTGQAEALELRDGVADYLGGKSVMNAVNNVQSILAKNLIGMDATNQAGIDAMMIALDGTPNKSKLGANAILGCSMAVVRAAAAANHVPLFRYLGGPNAKLLPTPMVQILGGGAHALNSINIQDFLVVPLTGGSFSEGYEMVVNTYNATKKVFAKYGKPLATADEGGFWPTDFKSNEEGLKLLTEGILQAGYVPGKDLSIALDIAASEFYDKAKDTYNLSLENKALSRAEFVECVADWVNKYAIISIEDGMDEGDWEGWGLLAKKLDNRVQLIGDDLFTTNISRIQKGVGLGIGNSVLIKMNQIGTITETLDAIEYTKNHGYLPVISARSGETEDETIVHLAVATNAGQLKVGSVARSERTVKWNEAIRVQEYLGPDAQYLGGKIFDRIIPGAKV